MTRLSMAISAVVLSFAAGISALPHTSIAASASDAGNSPMSLDFTLDLGGLRFDPLHMAPPVGRAAESGPDFRLVQFDGPMRADWLANLRASGVEPMQYIHPYSYVVWADGDTLAQAAARSEVRWTGDFAPEFGVIPHQRNFDGAIRPTMALISRHADESALRAALTEHGAFVHDISPVTRHFSVVHLDVSGSRYLDLATIAGIYTVQEIRPETGPRGEMSNQSVVGNYGPAPTFTIVPGYEGWLIDSGYDGTGVTVGIVDGGINVGHQDLASRIVPCVSAGGTPTSCTNFNNNHGSHVAGAVAGTGASGITLNGFLRGQGVAPGANVIQQRYVGFTGAGPGGMIPNGMLTIYKESALSGAVLTNNSWGPTDTPQGYDIPTQQIDIISRDANPDLAGSQPVLAVWSIMNGNGDGNFANTCLPSSVASPDEAKNLFAVGSTKMQSGGGAQINDILDISSNSAHGNACDGRRIPHIVAPGCSTDSTSSGGATSFGFACGTSMASPVVSGAVAVYIEQYRDQNAGETPSPALVKAAFTAAAQNLQGFRNADNGIMGHRPDRFQGYGRLDLDKVINPGTDVFSIDQTEVFTSSGDSWSETFEAADPDEPMLIMLAWTDAPGHGLGGTTPAWVNNLDLEVLATSGTYMGNVIGADGWSATGGSADTMNNLEGVFLTPAQHGGSVEISVLATNIAADALDPFNPTDPAQDFALVCYNCVDGEGPPPVGEADIGTSLFALPNPAEIGDDVTFVAQVGNFGPDSANGVEFELELSGGLVFSEGRTVTRDKHVDRQVRGGTWDCSEEAGTVTCTLPGSLPATSLAPTLEIVTTVGPSATPGLFDITGTVSANQTDPNPANNSVTVEIEIVGKPDGIFANDFECAKGLPDCEIGNPDLVVIEDIDFVPNPDFTGGSIQWADGTTCDCDTAPFNFNVYGTATTVQFFWPNNANGVDGGLSLDGGTTYALLESGATIGPASDYMVLTAAAATVAWSVPGNVDGYLGFRFVDDGVTKYGFAHITTGADGRPFTIHSVTYNNIGDPVTIP